MPVSTLEPVSENVLGLDLDSTIRQPLAMCASSILGIMTSPDGDVLCEDTCWILKTLIPKKFYVPLIFY